MKLLVLGDSHGCAENLAHALEMEKPDKVLYLGDGVRDFELLRERYYTIPMIGVSGNCDIGSELPLSYADELEGVRLFACHGHRYQVKSTLLWLKFAAMESSAALCCYGHTHIPKCESVSDITFLNPGACGGLYPSYGVVVLQNGTFSCEIKQLVP